MDTAAIDEILADMTPEEILLALPYINDWERAQCMTHEEANEWRRRILALQSLMRNEAASA